MICLGKERNLLYPREQLRRLDRFKKSFGTFASRFSVMNRICSNR